MFMAFLYKMFLFFIFVIFRRFLMNLLIFLSSVNSKFFQVLSVVIFRIITMYFQKKIIFSNSMNVFIFSFLNFDTLIHQMWLLLSPKSQFEISITYLSPSFLRPPYPAHEKISNKTCHRFLSSSQAEIHQGALSTLNATPPASYVSPCFVVNVSKLKVHNIFFLRPHSKRTYLSKSIFFNMREVACECECACVALVCFSSSNMKNDDEQ